MNTFTEDTDILVVGEKPAMVVFLDAAVE